MRACGYAAVLLLLLLAVQWAPSSAKKVKIGETDIAPDDEWDKEMDEEWESWGKKIKDKVPKKEMSVDEIMAQLKNQQSPIVPPADSPRDVIWLSLAMAVSMAAAFVYMLATGEAAGYGRYSADEAAGARLGLSRMLVGPRVAWCIQELPALLWPLALAADPGALVWRRTPNLILWGLFVLHYANRSLVYPLRIVNGKPTELHVMLAALLFCMVNGYMQARSLCDLDDYGQDWALHPQFLAGVAMAILGWCINFHSDGVLRSLRQPSRAAAAASGSPKVLPKQQRYRIPRGGAFDLLCLSCPNYGGELLEWAGFMVACNFSAAATAFAFATAANLIPRAISHHRWYLAHLNGYPRHRRAIIPWLV